MKTALLNTHKESNAKIVNFAGYDMPLFYTHGMVKEHMSVRTEAGIFDVSHMGQAIISGDNLEKYFSIITPTNFKDTKIGKAKYSVLLNKDACPIDDLIIYKLSDNQFYTVLNASRKEIDLAWMRKHLASEYDAKIDVLTNRSLLAIQGPKTTEKLSNILPAGFQDIEYMSMIESTYKGQSIYIARTGYTGENGYEISISDDQAQEFWKDVINAGVEPIGLGARDSLRLEAGYPLYGHELSEEINIANSTMKWIITSDENYIGKDNLETPPTRKRVGIKLLDKGIIREGMKVIMNDQEIATLTSGAYIPSLETSIGQSYLPRDIAKNGTEIEIEIRGKRKKAIICKTSFL